MRLTLCWLLLAACSSDGKPTAEHAPAAPAAASDSAQTLAAAFLPVSLGASVDAVRSAVPDLTPSGWSSGSRATWLGSRGDARVELETDGGRVVGVTLEWDGEGAVAADKLLAERLPPASDCSPLSGQVADFRPRVWRLAGQGGATALKRGTHLRLEIVDPAPPDVLEAVARCAH